LKTSTPSYENISQNTIKQLEERPKTQKRTIVKEIDGIALTLIDRNKQLK